MKQPGTFFDLFVYSLLLRLPFDTGDAVSPISTLIAAPPPAFCNNDDRISGNSMDPDSAVNLFGSMFGAIKDISVSNIHANENDKTKDFLAKDLAAIFSEWDLVEDEEAGKSSTASAPAAVSPHPADLRSSSWEDLTLVPLPELHKALPSDGVCQTDPASNQASLTTGSAYTRRPLTLDTTGAAQTGAYIRKSHAAENNDSGRPFPREMSASSKGKGKSTAHALSSGRKDSSGGKKSNINWAEQRSREKYCLPSYTEGSEGTKQKLSSKVDVKKAWGQEAPAVERCRTSAPENKVDEADGDEDVSLLQMAENLLQMTADVHSRMQEVNKGIQGFAEDARGISCKTKTPEASDKCSERERHSTRSRGREGSYSKHVRSSAGSHKLLGKDKETRILFRLPKTAWSLGGEESDGEDFSALPDPPQWTPESKRRSSTNYIPQHASPHRISSSQREAGGLCDFEDKKRSKNEDGEGSTKGARKKSSGKSSKKSKHKPQAEALMSSEAGHGRAVPVTVSSSTACSPKEKTRRSWARSSHLERDDLLYASPALSRSDIKNTAQTRQGADTLSPELDSLSIKVQTRELKEDEYADIVRESASSMFPLLPSPPPPAPPSPSFQSKVDQPAGEGSPSTQDQSAEPAVLPTHPADPGSPQNVIKYCLRRNIYSGTLQQMEVNDSAADYSRVTGEPDTCAPLVVDSTLNSSAISTVTAAAASALTASDHYETAASDVENWEDARASLPGDENVGLIKTKSHLKPEKGSEPEELGSVYV